MRQGPYTETVAIASSAVITERISEKFIERVDKQPATRPTVFVSLSLNWLYRIHKDRSMAVTESCKKPKKLTNWPFSIVDLLAANISAYWKAVFAWLNMLAEK